MQKRVIVQILRAPIGGIRKHVVDILEGLSHENIHQIFVTNTLETDKDLEYLKTKHHVEFFHVTIKDAPSPKDLINIIKIYNFLKTKKVDVLHGHGAKGGMYARALSIFLRAKSIYTPHGGSLHRVHGKIKNVIYDIIEKMMVPFTDIFLFESKYTAEVFAQNIAKVNKKVVINSNGLPIPQIQSNRLYEAGQKVRLGSFGLLRELKGHDIVIEACHILKSNSVPFEYFIYGDGDFEDHLKSLIAKYDLENDVHIKPYACDVYKEMMAFDFIIHPSRFESFGYVPGEAMSLKVPVIVSHIGGLKEVVDESTGYISYDNSPKSYADIITKLYKGDSSLKAKVDTAFIKIQTQFSQKAMIDRIKSFYF